MKTAVCLIRVFLAAFVLSAMAMGQVPSSFVFDWENPVSGYIPGGKSALGLVVLNSPAPTGGLWVNLNTDSSDLSVWWTKVFVPAGQTQSNTFTLTAKASTAAESVHVTASVSGTTISQTVNLGQPLYYFYPWSNATQGSTISGTLQLTTGTYQVVNLSTNVPGVTAPATVNAPHGQGIDFPIHCGIHVTTNTVVTISAWVTGFPPLTSTFVVTPGSPVASIIPLTTTSVAGTSSLTVTMADSYQTTPTINLSSSSPYVHIPSTAVITSTGKVTVPIVCSPVTTNTTVTLSAALPGYPSASTTLTLVPGWSFSPGNGAFNGPPIVGSNGVVYVATNAATTYPNYAYLYAVYPNGKQYWVDSFSNALTPPVTLNNVTYVADNTLSYVFTANVYALNADGSSKWTLTLPAEFGANTFYSNNLTVGPNGTVYVEVGGQYLFAITPAGKLAWQFSMDAPNSTPASRMTLSTPTTSANGATVYVSAYYNNPDGAASVYDDDAVAINWATGAVKWTTPLGVSDGIVDDVPPPVVSPANGSVIASVITDGPPESLLLSAIDPASGKINWKTSVADQPNFTYQFILTLTGDIYVRTNSELVALNASGGSLWTYPVTFGAFNAICVTPDGSSFFPDADDVLYGLSPTGGPLWSKSPKTSGVYTGALTIGPDGVLYAQGSGQSYTKSIYAIDPTTGNYTWQYQTDQPFQYGFAFAHDGTIYYATNQGKLVAVKWTPPPVSP